MEASGMWKNYFDLCQSTASFFIEILIVISTDSVQSNLALVSTIFFRIYCMYVYHLSYFPFKIQE